MKKTTQSLLMMLLLLCGQAFAQNTQIIDISTGINSSGQLIPLTQFDDNWIVKTPSSSSFSNVSCGSGIPNGHSAPYVGKDMSVRWLSPDVNSSGNHLNVSEAGFYEYRMHFNVSTCNIKSAVINLVHIGGDNEIDQITLNNNTPHALSFSHNPFTNNTIIALSSSELVLGQNFITVRVNNFEIFTGMEIKGEIIIEHDWLDFELRNKNNQVNTEYCIEEDVFLKDIGSFPAGIRILQLSEMNGNTPVWTMPFGVIGSGQVLGSPIGLVSGNPFEVNITKLFENNVPTPVVFQPGKTYRIKLLHSGGCGLVEVSKEFTYKCCTSSINAFFGSKINNGQLSVISPMIKGTHEWKVYSIANGVTGQYTLLKTYTTPNFLFDLTGTSTCYYVTHSITTPCGDACAAQIICKAECGDKECNLTVPTGLSVNHANGTTDILTWNSVPGAVSYTIEVTPNDPRCCGGDGPLSAPYVFSNVSSPYTLSVGAAEEGPIGPGETVLRCYSWRVVAKCPDGGIVYSASKCSEGDGIVSGGGNEHGEMGKRNTSSVDKPIQQKSAQVNVYPNPTKAIISFEVNTIKEEVCNIIITDLGGKKIESFYNMKTSNKKLSINWNTSSLSAGEYFVKIITSDKQIIIKKFIKE